MDIGTFLQPHNILTNTEVLYVDMLTLASTFIILREEKCNQINCDRIIKGLDIDLKILRFVIKIF